MNKQFSLTVSAILVTVVPLPAAEPFSLKEGDRVVLLGNTLIEREQRYGYWELALTARFPGVTFRNLGWSGDTVWGEARAGFGSQADGFRELKEHVLALKPTVLIIGYGGNEAFDGPAGLPKFEKGLNELLDALAPTKARVVLLSPPLVDEFSWPGGSVDDRNRCLRLYTDVIKQTAERRQAVFVAEFCQRYGPAHPLTDDGTHLTAIGYWQTAQNLLNELRLGAGPGLEPVELVGEKPLPLLQKILRSPPVPPTPGIKNLPRQADCIVRARNLKPGKYTLKIDGKAVHTADAETWMKTMDLLDGWVFNGPSLDQAEKLRQAIVEKNRLYFHRWRPQNVTYIFGFRKAEQGKNAVEIPQFDPLIAEKEAEIAKLRVPVPHVYEIKPE